MNERIQKDEKKRQNADKRKFEIERKKESKRKNPSNEKKFRHEADETTTDERKKQYSYGHVLREAFVIRQIHFVMKILKQNLVATSHLPLRFLNKAGLDMVMRISYEKIHF